MFEPIVEYISKRLVDGLWNYYLKKTQEKDYQLIEITDVFGSAEPLLRYYVEPNCQNINPANFDENEPDAVVKTPVFDFINSYLNREFAVQGDGRNQLFVLSDAGVGKTSLLLMIKLCQLLPQLGLKYDLENDRNVELIKLDAAAIGKIQRIEQKADTVLLLDALDEDPLAWPKPEDRLLKVLQASATFRRVIISCRTQFFPDRGVRAYGSQERIAIGGFVCPMVFLSLFDEEQVVEYLLKRFPISENSENLEKQNKAVVILKKAKSLSFRPFLLSHIEDFLESENQEWTELSVYDELIQVWMRREIRKKSATKLTMNDLWIACLAIAARMQETGMRQITKNELSKIIQSIPKVSSINNLDYGTKSLLNRNSLGEYRFSHFSVQEYFLAKYVTSLSIEYDKVRAIPIQRNRIRLTAKALEFISSQKNKSWSNGDRYLLEGLDLDGFDFSGSDYSGCSFAGSKLRDCKFQQSNLTAANFTNANLKGAIFDNSDCTNAVFSGADLTNCSLKNARSDKAIFADAIFNNTNLKGLSDLGKLPRGSRFIDTIMPDGTRRAR